MSDTPDVINQIDSEEVDVIVADDDETQRREIVEFLDRLNVSSVEAGDGATVRELFLRYRPKLVLMDINMPRMDGLEASRWLRGQRGGPKIVLMSGYIDRVREANESDDMGFVVIEKPVPLRTLGTFVKSVIKDKQEG
ncbi:response regulator [Rhodovibrionaceae bacterium A322]